MKKGDIVYINRPGYRKSYGIIIAIERDLIRIRILTLRDIWTPVGSDGQTIFHYDYNYLSHDVVEI